MNHPITGQPDRFWSRVELGETPQARPDLGPCWMWNYVQNGRGYGIWSFRIEGRMTSRGAHKFAYEGIRGKIAKGLELDHLCRVKLCCRPEHMEPVTHLENMRRVPKQPLPAACPQGHAYVDSNILWWKNNRRSSGKSLRCRTCERQRSTIRNATRGANSARTS